MKLTLILSILTISQLWATETYSQMTKLDLKLENVKISDALKEIENQSEFFFLYSPKLIDVERKVNIDAKEESIKDILNNIFNENVKFVVHDRQIILSPNEISEVLSASQQKNRILGTVIDKNGAPQIGVNVVVTGTTLGTITDIDGKYSIEVPQGTKSLTFSFIGMVPQEITIGTLTQINITMLESSIGLDEVVVIGYGTQKKSTLTGSISEVKGEVLQKNHQPNLLNSIAGKFSGVIANNRSGEPGNDDSRLYVRGLATTGNNDVLVVVDGIPGQIGGLSRIDPNDIASITVLKDASAAVYGSRAANGVILVTTIRGVKGKPTLDYSFNYGLSSPTRLPKMADAATYANIMNEISYFNNHAAGVNQYYTNDQIEKYRNGSDPLNYPNTDWADISLLKVAPQSKHNMSMSGGTDDLKYFVSAGLLTQDGIYKNGVTKYNQFNVRSNIDADITDRLKFTLNISAREEDRVNSIAGAYQTFRNIYRAYPTVSAVFPNGLPSTGVELFNPVVMSTDVPGTIKNPTYVLNTIMKLSYKIPGIDGLAVDGTYAIDKSWNFSKAFSKTYVLYDHNSVTDVYIPQVTGGSGGKPTLSESQLNNSLITSSIKLNYNKFWNNNNIVGLAGFEQSENKSEIFSATSNNFPSAETPELSQGGSAATDKLISGSSSRYSRRSFFGRISYDYSEKYLFEVQVRMDGSSIFPVGKQWGMFPAISGGWVISKESWFKSNVSFINNLKIRGSYGKLGNDNVDNFQYYDNYVFNNRVVLGTDIHAGIDLSKLANPNITWEVAKKTDIGIDATFFKNFSLSFIYFEQKRTNILAPRNASIPQVSGIVNGLRPSPETPLVSEPLAPYQNIGKINNAGFEATIGYKHTGEFSYNISANTTFARNEVIFVDEASGVLDYQKQTGKSLNSYLLYRELGIFRTDADLTNNLSLPGNQLGDLIYEDYNGDGIINANDMIRTKFGNIPELIFGFNFTANWKNFDLLMDFSGQSRVSQYVLPESGTVGNFYSSWADNRWSLTNTNGSYPRVDTRASSSINGGLYPSTFWLNDASFIRFKSFELGYTIPSSYLTKLGISALRVNLSGFNLFTLSKVKDYDPEGSEAAGQFYPQQKILGFGINVKF